MSGGDAGQRTITGSGRLHAQKLQVDAPIGRLFLVHPPAARLSFTLTSGAVTLGRNPGDHTPPIDEPTVSRRHLTLAWDAERRARVATDLGSRNGSWIDGRRLLEADGPRPVTSGSVLRVGHVLFVYESAPPGGKLPWVDDPEVAVSRDAIPGDSAAAYLLRAAVARVAPDPSAALVVGETGTGKELIAGEIHRLSRRRGPLVALNCAALSPQLVESQLFGHVRGAFTGADDAREGLVRAASGGTLFLDEIGELPVTLQAKLLRLIQEGEVQPVGGTRATKVDVRIVAATNRDLVAAVAEGGFRRDLYARLARWEIHVPPVRERRPDLLEWVERLHRRWQHERRLPPRPLAFEPVAAEALLLSAWPENLRGIDRLAHELGRESDVIGLERLPPWMKAPPARPESPTVPAIPSARMTAPTREELEAALRDLGSVSATAKHFGRDRRQIYRWMEAHGLSRDEKG
jgi:transcriptional regulator with GAF, ATPase, and Fis domain